VVRATQVTASCTHHGEGPFWGDRRGRLLFLDMLAGAVVELEPSGSIVRHPIGSVVAVVRARARGGYVLAVERGFAFTNATLDTIQTLPPVFSDVLLRMNEGGCDPQGRLFYGSMAYAMTREPGRCTRSKPTSASTGVDRGDHLERIAVEA
jgi:sugar lactone lactonase YvrE